MALVETWTSLVGGGFVCAGLDDRGTPPNGRSEPRSHVSSAAAEGDDKAAAPRVLLIDGIPADELLAQLRQGSRAALETWYRALHDPLWRMAVVLTRSREHAEEIVQDVFLTLWKHREHISSDVRAYLYTSVRNAAKERRRQDQMVVRLHDSVAHGYVDSPAMGEGSFDPAARVETGDFYDAFRRATASLTEREALAFRLRLEEELTFEQIGELLGVSKVGARKMIMRAEEKVRALLADFRDFRKDG
jgi:RNA polymerase sigma factor (sigma-70 family)